jgi:hypothetical protein
VKTKNTIKAILCVAMALAGVGAQANVNTFSGVPVDAGGPATYTEDGITATAASGVFWAWPAAGQLHLDESGYAGNTVDFTFAGGAFDAVSIDISYPSTGAVATFSAYDSFNNLLSSAVFNAGVSGTALLGFTGISRLRLVDTGSHFSVDNLVLTSAVPEPESVALMLAGLGMVGFMSRRRRAG